MAVKNGRPLVIISLRAALSGEFIVATEFSRVRAIEDNSLLFQATYYSVKGMSGAGVVAIQEDNQLKVVGIHVASHDTTVAVQPTSKKARHISAAKYNMDMMSINSNIHGHSSYCLICEPARIPEVTTFINS